MRRILEWNWMLGLVGAVACSVVGCGSDATSTSTGDPSNAQYAPSVGNDSQWTWQARLVLDYDTYVPSGEAPSVSTIDSVQSSVEAAIIKNKLDAKYSVRCVVIVPNAGYAFIIPKTGYNNREFFNIDYDHIKRIFADGVAHVEWEDKSGTPDFLIDYTASRPSSSVIEEHFQAFTSDPNRSTIGYTMDYGEGSVVVVISPDGSEPRQVLEEAQQLQAALAGDLVIKRVYASGYSE